MKFDAEIKKDISFMALGCAVCSAIIVLIFAVLGKIDFSVLLGALVGYVLSFGNFVLMSIGIIKALETGDEVTAKLKMKRSYVFRTIIMLIVMAVSITVKYVNWVPVVASVFYPRIIITLRGLWRRYKTRNDPQPEYSAVLDENDENKTDEFEKFVSGFSKVKTDDITNNKTGSKESAPNDENKNQDDK